MKCYLGVDVGSVSTNIVVIDDDMRVLYSLYTRTNGRPIETVQAGLRSLKEQADPDWVITGVGTTGSGRHLAAVVLGADVVKNEITTHAVAAMLLVPGVQTVIEIGGQDSKITLIRNGVIVDFGMNTICAAGTGSFLDQQAARLRIPIEELGDIALRSTTPVRIAGRCAVFAESDMIHKQQMGHSLPDILYGLCQALVRNYLNNVAKGKNIRPPVSFQGGVAANRSIKRAFEEALGFEVIVPPYHDVMGAIGAAVLAKEHIETSRQRTAFRGFGAADIVFESASFECQNCPNRCEIVQLRADGRIVARWGGRCQRWDSLSA